MVVDDNYEKDTENQYVQEFLRILKIRLMNFISHFILGKRKREEYI